MAREWDKANMKTMGVNVKKETAEAFRQYAAERGTTVGALLRGFIEATMADPKQAEDAGALGVAHIVSYKNTDLLKAETAHHNPDNLNPDGMLNDILDEYFRFVRKVRR